MNTPLEARGLNVWRGQRKVLHDIHASFGAGCWTCVVGPNGAGKTTLLKALAGLLESTGEVLLAGQPLSSFSPKARARQMAWLSQNDVSMDDLSVQDVVMLGRLPHQQWWQGATALDHQVVEACLHAQQIADWRFRSLGTLSGGERQRVLLARALAVSAPVLLMDEPVANADLPHQSDWLRTVRAHAQQGHTVVSVLHDLNLALCAQQLVVMDQGKVVMQSSADNPLLHDCLKQVFGPQLSVHRVQDRWVVLPA
ncbi:MAG: ABC transporter ATP-binding protein [Limnohabitans sp.]